MPTTPHCWIWIASATLLALATSVPPGRSVPPCVHASGDEMLYILEGELAVSEFAFGVSDLGRSGSSASIDDVRSWSA